MKLELYSEALHGQAVEEYRLADTPYAGGPKASLADARADKDKLPIVISADGQMVGFYFLHLNDGPKLYGYIGDEYALIRNFSIDARFQGKGFATASFEGIFDFIHGSVSPKITELVLGVNGKNSAGQRVYEKAGFRKEFVTAGRKGDLVVMRKSYNRTGGRSSSTFATKF